MTDIEVYRQPAAPAIMAVQAEPDLDSWVTVVQEVSRLAGVICETDFVPKAYRGNAAATTAAILAGRELGLPPMTALRHMQVVEGSPSLSAEYKRARVLSAGHEFDVIERTTEKCKVSGRRRGSTKPPLVVEFTIQDAQRAKLIKDRGAWQTRPRRMLFARASTELCDTLFADVTNGLPTTELLTDDGDGFGGYDEQAAEAARPTGRVTRAEITGRTTAPQTASPATTAPRAPETPPTPQAERVAGEAPSEPGEDVPEPRPATMPQITAIWTVLNTVFKFGSDEKDQARLVCAHIVGHDLASTKDMTKDEAGDVLDTLGSWRETAEQHEEAPRDFLIQLLATGEVPGDA